MKGLVILFIIGVVACVATVYMMRDKDQGVPVSLAFGEPTDGSVEMHVVVATGMFTTEGPDAGRHGTPMYDEWIDEHLSVQDASKTSIKLARAGNSKVVDSRKVPGTPEFFAVAKLKPGVEYTLDYIPRKCEAKRYRYKFTAPNAATPVASITFQLAGK